MTKVVPTVKSATKLVQYVGFYLHCKMLEKRKERKCFAGSFSCTRVDSSVRITWRFHARGGVFILVQQVQGGLGEAISLNCGLLSCLLGHAQTCVRYPCTGCIMCMYTMY